MSLRTTIRTTLFASLVACAAACGGTAEEEEAAGSGQAATVARPPQFVLLAFDGSYNLPFWRESRAFAQQNNLKFTYFISGVYFVPNAQKALYFAPRNGQGKSAIGWGGTAPEIAERYAELRLANAEGHEIASHANSHFDGSRWSAEDWSREFDQFDAIISPGIGVTAPTNLGFGPRDVVGFRAPQLGHSPGLFQTMPLKSYTYDTSKSDSPSYWPQKNNGVWNFPLARLRIEGSGKGTLSMDYNFYVADSNAQPNAAGKETFKRQMIDTYMKYFQANYFGNRAPVHIGHHFSKWNGGAYWEAMQTFARRVCGQPEVKCVTYKDLAEFVESHSAEIPDYRAARFTPMPRPPSQSVEPLSEVGEDEITARDDDAAHEQGAVDE